MSNGPEESGGRTSRLTPAGAGMDTTGLALILGSATAMGLLWIASEARGRHRTPTAARPAAASPPPPEVTRSMTVERPVDDILRLWRDGDTLARIFGFLGTIRSGGTGLAHWEVAGAMHRRHAWDMRLSEGAAGALGWTAEGDDALVRELRVRLRPAGADRGTVVTLTARFDPPGGMLGAAARALFGDALPGALANKALHLFKSLALTGEIPSTERQPAARTDPR